MANGNGAALVRHEAPQSIVRREDSPGFTENEIDLIKTQIAPGVTDGELKLFLHVCKSRQLDPFAKQIYAITREQWNAETQQREKKMTIMASIDGFRLTAKRGGIEAIDEPEFEYDARLKSNSNPLGLVKASVKVWRKGVERATVGVAYWDEYAQTKRNGELMGLWPKMPRTMLAKCAEAQALRKAAPEELSGLYAPEEMDQADNPPRHETRATEPQQVKASPAAAATTDQPAPATDSTPQDAMTQHQFEFVKNAIEECAEDAALRKLGVHVANANMSDEFRKELRAAYAKRRNKLAKLAREASAKPAEPTAQEPVADAEIDRGDDPDGY